MLYILMITVTLASFLVMLRTISADSERWQIVAGTAGFLLTFAMALFFFVKLRRTRDG
jgi:uncharacterized membrane protein